jgi:hypothetical protein
VTITVGAWVIPLLLTLACLGAMFRPYRREGDYDFGAVFRLAWLIPVGFVWAAYFGIVLWLK